MGRLSLLLLLLLAAVVVVSLLLPSRAPPGRHHVIGALRPRIHPLGREELMGSAPNAVRETR